MEGGDTMRAMRINAVPPAEAEEGLDEMSASISIRAYNADGESIVSTESVEITMGRDAIPGN